MIKIKHGDNENFSSFTQQLYQAAYAYVHALIEVLFPYYNLILQDHCILMSQ